MKTWGLPDWARQAIVDAIANGEKGEAVAAEFGVHPRYPYTLAIRYGVRRSVRGRPRKNHQPTIAVLITDNPES